MFVLFFLYVRLESLQKRRREAEKNSVAYDGNGSTKSSGVVWRVRALYVTSAWTLRGAPLSCGLVKMSSQGLVSMHGRRAKALEHVFNGTLRRDKSVH